MAGLAAELRDILSEQLEEYEKLLGFSENKRVAVIENNIEAIKAATASEHSSVGKIQRLERTRARIVKDIANVLNEKESNITLKGLAETMSSLPEAPDFIELGKKLNDTLGRLKELNNTNSALISSALDYLDFSINVMRSTYEMPTVYGEDGQVHMIDGGGVVDSRS